MDDSERAYQARVEIFSKPEVGADPQAAAHNRQLSGVLAEDFPDMSVRRIGRVVEFDVTAARKRDARRRTEGLMDELLVNPVSEEGTYQLELKPDEPVSID